MEYIAHKQKNDPAKTQAIYDHLSGTAVLAESFAEAFDAAQQGSLAGWAHDVGKYSKEFQDRIKNDGPRVDHATAGARECWNKGDCFASFCVAGHHSGLPNLGSEDSREDGTLCARLKKILPDYSAWKTEISLPDASFPDYVNKDCLTDMFFIRMLYSCLVDADFLDTERFMEEQNVSRGGQADIEELERRLDQYIEGWFPPKGVLNEKRCQILESCIRRSGEEQGFFTLTVPTGGGKTVASLTFAIKHAMAHGLRRIIYVVPYTSIIEQTADVFRRILGSDNVLEHHSNVEFTDDELTSEESIRLRLATENWDMPVIVTTAVQFFESLFACKSSKCRKIHNIAKSVVVFDEAQMLPLPYLKPCVYAISQLVRHYHVSAVLCTATQPALGDVFKEFVPDYSSVELCPRELSEDPVFKRTRINTVGTRTWSEIADQINDEKQILCIVNSRKSANEVYKQLSGEGRFHLSTLMTPFDRKEKLREIRERLRAGSVCRVVSTSLIEAGVDVDFPTVLREEAGLDSIVQAAGRCNREGREKAEKSIVEVFQPAETKTPEMFHTSIAAFWTALREGDRNGESISDLKTIERYYKELFLLRGNEALDKRRIVCQSSNQTFPFQSIAEQFHLIEQEMTTVYIPIGDGRALVDRLRQGEFSKKLMRNLALYGVSIYPQHFKALEEAGDIEPTENAVWFLKNPSLYSRETGLSLEADYGKAEFV